MTPTRAPAAGWNRWLALVPYGFLAPFLLGFAVFWVWPILYSLYLSFADWTGGVTTWVGTKNYERLLADPIFRQALRNTLLILGVQVPFMITLALLLALGLNSTLLRFRGLYRFGFFAPLVVGTVSYAAIFRLIFNDQFGVLNAGLRAAGLDPVAWLFTPGPAQVVIIIGLTWRWTGYNAIILLAGLQTISRDLYEASAIDGATGWRQTWHITLPLLRPAILFCVVLSVIGTMQLFTEPAILTAGGPANATLTLGLYLYRRAFQSADFGYASAIAYAVALITIVFSLIQFRLLQGARN